MLTLKQLATFVTVVELGTLDRAAQRLGTSQSTVSKRLSELEAATGLLLFDRSRRTGRLTEEGERLMELAAETCSMADRILALSDHSTRSTLRLRIGFTELSALTWLPGFLHDYALERPNLRLEIVIDMSRPLHQQLQDGELDLIVLPLETEMSFVGGTVARPMGRVEMAFMARKGLVPQDTVMTFASLNKFVIIGQGKRSGLAQNLNRWLVQQGNSGVNHVVDSLLATVGLVTAGQGIAVLPQRLMEALVHSPPLDLIRVEKDLPDITYYCVHSRGARQNLLEELSVRLEKAVNFTNPFFQ